MDAQIATEEQLYLLVTRGYSKRAMEKFFSIDSVNEDFLLYAQEIKDLGYSHFIENVKRPLSKEEETERDKFYRQEVDNLVESAILVREHRQNSLSVKNVGHSAALPKTKAIKKQNKVCKI